jgi:predicted permease
MRNLRRWLSRVAGVFTGARRDRELMEELESHLQLEMDEHIRRGISSHEARRLALVASGGVEAAKEAYRDQRGVPFVEHLLQDVRYAARTLRRAPGFTAVAVISLALGIGANTAVFSVVNAALLRKLPVDAPGDLVVLEWISGPQSPARSIDGSIRPDEAPGSRRSTSFSVPMFERLREQTATLEGVFAFAPIEQLNVLIGDGAEIADGQVVSGNYFRSLGVGAFRGRTLMPDDDRPDAPPAIVISHEYWQRRFGGDAGAIGRHVSVNGAGFVIVGVTPPAFTGALGIEASPDISIPLAHLPLVRQGSAPDLTNADFWWIRIMGRRAPGISAQQARAELEPVFQGATLASLVARGGLSDSTRASMIPRLRVSPGDRGLEDGRASLGRSLLIMSSVVALVLLIACANVANLLLTRATTRHREISVRLALGAERARIVKQLLVESLVIVAIAEAFGFLVAHWGANLLRRLTPEGRMLDLSLDLGVFAVTTIVAVSTALLFGLAPALRATRVDVADGLKDAAGRLRDTGSSLFARGLVVVQIGMSVVLLVYGALFARSLYNLRTVDVGFNLEHLLLFRVDPRLSNYNDSTIPPLYARLLAELSAIPGAKGVTLTRHPQLSGSRRTQDVNVIGRPPLADNEVAVNLVGPRFFETMELPIRVGRALDARDDRRSSHVTVVNESFVRRFLGSDAAIGRRLTSGDDELEIVGVARDAKYFSVRSDNGPIIYVPYAQHDQGQANITIRTSGDMAATLTSVRAVVRRVDKTLSMFDVRTQMQALDDSLAEERLFAMLSLVFGGLAITLACIGVYGVISYSTARRTGEIGLRLALGASGRDIVWLVMRRTVVLVVIGVTLGILAGFEGARVFETLLFELSPTDPASIIIAAALIALVAFVAAYVPADRARRVSPLVALRHE